MATSLDLDGFADFGFGKFVIFGHEGFLALFPFGMQLNAVDRADDFASRLVVVPDTLRARIGVDDVNGLSH